MANKKRRRKNRRAKRQAHLDHIRRVIGASMQTLMDYRNARSGVRIDPCAMLNLADQLIQEAARIVHHPRLCVSDDAMLDAWLCARLAQLLEGAAGDVPGRGCGETQET